MTEKNKYKPKQPSKSKNPSYKILNAAEIINSFNYTKNSEIANCSPDTFNTATPSTEDTKYSIPLASFWKVRNLFRISKNTQSTISKFLKKIKHNCSLKLLTILLKIFQCL